ncbi:hypothetical protein BJ925_2417 [Rahnella aquatilis]|jgi:hypothetical protein|nr:hypothetical protein BJ925_2417 [Rahnella aquatilis]
MSRVAFPFLIIPEETVKFEGWMISDLNGIEALSPSILNNWDYERDIQVRLKISVDFQTIANFLGFDPSDLTLAVVLYVGTGAGSLPRRINKAETSYFDKNCTEVMMKTLLIGRELSGQLRLDLQIVLQSPINSGGILSPKYIGSRLWQSHLNILLEDGGDSRFPIELARFTERFAGKTEQNALWLVDWQPEYLHADFGGNVRLYVNSDYPDFANRFVLGDAKTLQVMISDVMTQMIEHIIELGEDDIWLSVFEEGSVGYQTRIWLEWAFPGHSLASVKKLKDYNPGVFRAAILAVADIGEND